MIGQRIIEGFHLTVRTRQPAPLLPAGIAAYGPASPYVVP